MNNVPAVPTVSAQVLEPVTEGSADELRDTLVPAQEDELPQGVLDLLAALSVRHRSGTLGPVGVQGLDRFGLVERHLEQAHSHLGMRFPVGASLLAMAAVQAPINPQGSPRVSTETPSTTPEPLPAERAANASSPSTLAADTPLPEALMNLHSVRHALSAAPLSIPSLPTPVPRPALDMKVETLVGSSPGMLQIPFNKGAASGQVTITRVPDDPTHNLLLSPSNPLVFEQLKAPFERVGNPDWRLTDDGGEQQHQGSHQSRDEEQAEQQELPA